VAGHARGDGGFLIEAEEVNEGRYHDDAATDSAESGHDSGEESNAEREENQFHESLVRTGQDSSDELVQDETMIE